MKKTYLRLICRPDRLSAVDEKLISNCQAFGIALLTRSSQSYWKDDRCSEANYEFSSSISLEKWYQFFCVLFGTENNTIEGDRKAITHNGSPIINDTEVFAYLFIEE